MLSEAGSLVVCYLRLAGHKGHDSPAAAPHLSSGIPQSQMHTITSISLCGFWVSKFQAVIITQHFSRGAIFPLTLEALIPENNEKSQIGFLFKTHT